MTSPAQARSARQSGAAAARRIPAAVRAVVALLVVVALVYSTGTWLWRHVAPDVMQQDQYRLDASRIVVTPPPAWLRTDVKAAVIRDAGLDRGLSVLDPKISELIAGAFELHPWVEGAEVAIEYPAQVRVDLKYRRPVAVLQLDGAGANLELLPIDAHGRHLPEDGLTPTDKRGLPRIVGLKRAPSIGQVSDEARLLGAVRLAVLLGEHWVALDLAKIVPPVSANPAETDDNAYSLVAESGARIVWGKAPGDHPSEAAVAKEMLARLLRHARATGLPEGPLAVLDLRKLPPEPRPEGKSEPRP